MTAGDDPAGALSRALDALPATLAAEVAAALAATGDEMVEQARRLLADPGPGPSVPGAPPRDPGGRLAGSLAARLDADATSVSIAAASPQAAYLEYGTRRMAARPFLRPAGEAVRPAAIAHCRDALLRAARSLEGGT